MTRITDGSKPGLYDLVREHFGATPARKREIEAERKARFPFVEGWPEHPDMVYTETAPDRWGWGWPTGSWRFIDNDGIIKGRRGGP